MDAFWRGLWHITYQLERHFNTDNVDLAERLMCQCNTALELIRAVTARFDEYIHVERLDVHSGAREIRILMELGVMIHFLQDQSCHFADVASNVVPFSALERSDGPPEVCHTGQRGRPSFVIPLDQLEALIDLGLNMSCIALILGVSERTVRRRREMYGLPIGRDRYSLLLDSELDQIVSDILQVWHTHTHTQLHM